jgi:hypothetical protein
MCIHTHTHTQESILCTASVVEAMLSAADAPPDCAARRALSIWTFGDVVPGPDPHCAPELALRVDAHNGSMLVCAESKGNQKKKQ